MIYTLLRLGADGIYMITKISYDGICYLVYGHQETPEEKVSKEIMLLKSKADHESMELREIKRMLKTIMKNNKNKNIHSLVDVDNVDYVYDVDNVDVNLVDYEEEEDMVIVNI
jgi:hypothetical protein